VEEAGMAQLIVRNLPESIVQALKLRATRHGRSTEAEHRRILEEAIRPSRGKTLKDALLAIPSVGEDADFVRPKDKGRVVLS
jgi:antitoxin FitA